MELRDPVSCTSHLATAIWAAYATLILVRLTPRGSALRPAVVVFGLSMVLLYAASGTFHGVPYTKAQNPVAYSFFQRLDQSAILCLIAGTNTPCLVGLIGGSAARWFLGALWGLAAVGIGCLWLLPKPPYEIIVGICLGMGWLGAVPMKRYFRAIGWRSMNWVWVGGAAYTLGAICELTDWPNISAYPVRIGSHEVFHLFDIVGSVAFFLFIVRHVIPYESAPAGDLKVARG